MAQNVTNFAITVSITLTSSLIAREPPSKDCRKLLELGKISDTISSNRALIDSGNALEAAFGCLLILVRGGVASWNG